MLLDKKQMSEEDIKRNFITPALHIKGWHDKITMETLITDGRIHLGSKGKSAVRGKPKFVDYLLYLTANNPIAVVDAVKVNTGAVAMSHQN